MRQIRKVRIVHWRSQSNQGSDSRVFAANTEPNPATKAKTRNQQRHVWIFHGEKIQRGTHIVTLAHAAIVLSFAHSRSAKIKTQYRKSQRVERFCRLIHYFVVHRPAKKRMRVANERGHWRRAFAGAPENGFQSPGRAGKKEIAGVVPCAHKSSKKCECTATPEKHRNPQRARTPFSTRRERVFNRLTDSELQIECARPVSKWMPFRTAK